MKKIFLIMTLFFVFCMSIFAESKNNSNNQQIKISATWKDNKFNNIRSNTHDSGIEKISLTILHQLLKECFMIKKKM